MRRQALVALCALAASACPTPPGGVNDAGPQGLPSFGNAAAVLTSAQPDLLAARTAPVELTLDGAGFLEGAVVLLDGAARTFTRESATRGKVTLVAGDVSSARLLEVRVQNPEAAPSNAMRVRVVEKNPVPVLTALSPTQVTAGAGDTALEVRGDDFAEGAEVRLGGAARPTTRVSAQVLTCVVPAALLATQGAVEVTVENPAPGGGLSAPLSLVVEAPAGNAGVVQHASVALDGGFANQDAFSTSLSATGRYLAFVSEADDLVPSDTNGRRDVFVRDTCVGAPAGCVPSTQRVSLATDGGEPDNNCEYAVISGGGRYVGFLTSARNIVPYTDNFRVAVVADTCLGAAGCTPSTQIISTQDDGGVVAADSWDPMSISSDGRAVSWVTYNVMVPEDTNGNRDVYLRDTCLGVTSGCTPQNHLVSGKPDGGTAAANEAKLHALSPDGRYVAFITDATEITDDDLNSSIDVFLRDTCVGAAAGCVPQTLLVSRTSTGAQVNNGGFYGLSVSSQGRYVAFSTSQAMVPEDTDGAADIYARDTCLGVGSGCTPNTYLLTRKLDGGFGSGSYDMVSASLTPDGRYLGYHSSRRDLVPQDNNGVGDIFVQTTCLGAVAACTIETRRASVSATGAEGASRSGANNIPSFGMSATGRYVSFDTQSSNFAPDDTAGRLDAFLSASGF
jgi:IPT/TIG domain